MTFLIFHERIFLPAQLVKFVTLQTLNADVSVLTIVFVLCSNTKKVLKEIHKNSEKKKKKESCCMNITSLKRDYFHYFQLKLVL